MHPHIVLNHISFTTDIIVQVNYLLRRTRTPVFRFESHAFDLHSKVHICGLLYFTDPWRWSPWSSCMANHSY